MIRSISKFLIKGSRRICIYLALADRICRFYGVSHSVFLIFKFFSVKITSEGIVTSFVKFENFQRAFSVDVTFLKNWAIILYKRSFLFL